MAGSRCCEPQPSASPHACSAAHRRQSRARPVCASLALPRSTPRSLQRRTSSCARRRPRHRQQRASSPSLELHALHCPPADKSLNNLANKLIKRFPKIKKFAYEGSVGLEANKSQLAHLFLVALKGASEASLSTLGAAASTAGRFRPRRLGAR